MAGKQLTNNEILTEDVERFVKEISLLSQLRHPNILLFLGASIDYPSIFYITEYLQKGNLRQILEKEKLPWKIKISMAMDTARGMNYLHKGILLYFIYLFYIFFFIFIFFFYILFLYFFFFLKKKFYLFLLNFV